jgi:hypothetical protein
MFVVWEDGSEHAGRRAEMLIISAMFGNLPPRESIVLFPASPRADGNRTQRRESHIGECFTAAAEKLPLPEAGEIPGV